MTTKLSVALVTRNRIASLERCLLSWRKQTVAPAEIVISDDSDPGIAAEIERMARRFACRYQAGPGRGLYANRNAASLACAGTHILSADDDHAHPPDYVEQILGLIQDDPARVWIFTERHPGEPDAPLACPAELHRSGFGQTPADPSDCAAIADGSSVYPREIFDQGLRYDESYVFGPMWYLWGQKLVRAGWRISFSDRTFIWHFCEGQERAHSLRELRRQLEAITYVVCVRALSLSTSPSDRAWGIYYYCRRMLVPDSLIGYTVRSRLPLSAAVRALRRAWASRASYAAPARKLHEPSPAFVSEEEKKQTSILP